MHRSSTLAAWADVTGAFLLGAALAYLLSEVVDRDRHVPGPINDDVVRERVRQRVSQLVSRPDAINVTVEEGIVRLTGDVLPQERDALLHGVVHMPGVWRVRNALGIVGS